MEWKWNEDIKKNKSNAAELIKQIIELIDVPIMTKVNLLLSHFVSAENYRWKWISFTWNAPHLNQVMENIAVACASFFFSSPYKWKCQIWNFHEVFIAICTENWSAVRTALSNTFFLLCFYLHRSLALVQVLILLCCWCCAEVSLQCHEWDRAFTSVLWHMCVTSGLKSNVIQFHFVDIKIEFDFLFYYYFYAFLSLCCVDMSVFLRQTRTGDTLNCSTSDPFGLTQKIVCHSFCRNDNNDDGVEEEEVSQAW